MYPKSKPQPEFIPSWGRTPASRKDTGPGSLRKQCYLEVPFYSHHPLGGVWGKVSFEVKSGQVQKVFMVLDANQHTHRQTIGSFSSNFGPKEGPLHSKKNLK